MGLASKLAAAQGGSAAVANFSSQPGGAYPGQQQQQQQQYQAYPGPGAGRGQQSQQYSRPAPPPPPGGQSPYPGQQQPYSPAPYNQAPSYGQSQYGQPQYGQPQYGRPPPNQGYAGPPPPQQQGGYNAPPPGGQYGAQSGPPGGGAPHDIGAYQRQLDQAIQEKGLQAFYGPGTPGAQKLPMIAQRAAQQVDRLCQAWRIQREIAVDIVRLALYDVVVYIDDSGSMSFEENGERIKDLELIMQRVAFAATLFDDDGIEVRFMNDDRIPVNALSGIRSEQQVQQLLSGKTYKGLTPFGTELRKKVIDPIVIPKLRGQMQKPILIISITDGQPAGEGVNTLVETVTYAVQQARNSRYGPGAVAFQFAQVGNDQKATEFLAKMDNDPTVGREVDCTSNYENESAEMARAVPPVDLTPDLWMIKLILGAIDPSYDTKDEKTQMTGGSGPPPQQYGGQPQYGQGGYGGAPPPQQYGQPQGQYGQQQGRPGGGYPGQQPPYGQQPQYGQPPQHGQQPPYGQPPQYGGGPPRY